MALYRMIGGDGREYGPVSAEQLRQWLAEGRVDRNTRVMADDGQTAWLALSEVAEFADLFVVQQVVPPAPVIPPPGTVPPAYSVPPGATLPGSAVAGNSSMAVASLVMAILSLICCGLLAIPAVICGHLARRDIAASNGTMTGGGMALAGLIIGYALIIFVLVAILFFAIASA